MRSINFPSKCDVYRVNPDPDHTFIWLPGLCMQSGLTDENLAVGAGGQ
jgi:hypothetical protein